MNTILRRGETTQFWGTAARPNFDYFKFEIQPEDAEGWAFVARFNHPVTNGVLLTAGPQGDWDTTKANPGAYWLRLVVVDITGNYWPEFAMVRVIVEQ